MQYITIALAWFFKPFYRGRDIYGHGMEKKNSKTIQRFILKNVITSHDKKFPKLKKPIGLAKSLKNLTTLYKRIYKYLSKFWFLNSFRVGVSTPFFFFLLIFFWKFIYPLWKLKFYNHHFYFFFFFFFLYIKKKLDN